MSWIGNVVDYLCAAKRAGAPDYEAAWAEAVALYPPRRRDYGEPATSLFEEPIEGLVPFAYRVCRDAWFGERPMPNFERDLMLLRSREPGPRVALPA